MEEKPALMYGDLLLKPNTVVWPLISPKMTEKHNLDIIISLPICLAVSLHSKNNRFSFKKTLIRFWTASWLHTHTYFTFFSYLFFSSSCKKPTQEAPQAKEPREWLMVLPLQQNVKYRFRLWLIMCNSNKKRNIYLHIITSPCTAVFRVGVGVNAVGDEVGAGGGSV